MSVPKLMVHTDVILEHLCGSRSPSVLRQALGKFFCYVTVFHAVHLFSLASSAREQRAIGDAMAAMKIMGLNPNRALKHGRLLASAGRAEALDVLIAGLCLDSRLPLLTDRTQDFRNIGGLLIVPTRLVPQFESGRQILRAARRSISTSRL